MCIRDSFYSAAPKEAVFDGCFASAANRDYAKTSGIEELTFSKNRTLDIKSLVSSPKVHAKLRNFRAGIEAVSYTHLTLPTSDLV